MFKKPISAKTAFGPGPTEKEKAEKIAEATKKFNELKDSARKLVATEQFKEFKKFYQSERETLIETFKLIDPGDISAVAKIQERLSLYDQILGIEKKAE